MLQISDVPAEFIKSALVLVVGLAGGAGAVLTVAGKYRKQVRTIEQPLEVRPSPNLLSVEGHAQTHQEVDRRLEGHDMQIDSLWKTMRREDEHTRAETRKCLQDIERALGRIEGKLG